MPYPRLVATVFGTAGAGGIAKGLDLSTDGRGHDVVTYLGFYGIGVFLLVVALFLWRSAPTEKGDETKTEGDQSPVATGDQSPVAAGGRDATQAAGNVYKAEQGDINIGVSPQTSPQLSRSERLRLIRNEMKHVLLRCDELDDVRKEWTSIRPHSGGRHHPLPAEKWNAYGATLGLPDTDYEVIQEAYEFANQFNRDMENPPVVMGVPDPDLDGLRAAFEDAQRVLTKVATQPAPNPYAAANQMQRRWQDEELTAALLDVRQELRRNQRRLKNLLKGQSTQGFLGFPSAQWTSHENLVKRKAPQVGKLANEAYGLIIELREEGLEEETVKLLAERDHELGEEALGLFQDTIDAIDAGHRESAS